MEKQSRALLQAMSRKISQIRLNSELEFVPIFKDNNNELILKKQELIEEIKPLYCSPSDFIDEFGRFKVDSADNLEANCFIENEFSMPKHLETEGFLAVEKIKNYMKKRFPERLLQSRNLANLSEKVYKAWRSRTRRREAEWGDPEDLGKFPNDPRSEESKIAPENSQMAVEPKFLMPSYFIPNLSNKLYYSNRPSIQPTSPFSRFNANSAIWSPSERKTFIELYLQHPKNFARISAHLPHKSCEQCVEFYYRHKKEYKLKQMVASYRKAMIAQRKLILNTGGNMVNSSFPVNINANVNILPLSSVNNNTSISSLSIIDEETSVATTSSSASAAASTSTGPGRRKTGRPVGRPKNKDKQ